MTEETFRWVVAGGVGLAALSFVALAVAAIVAVSLLGKMKLKTDTLMDEIKPILEDVKATTVLLRPRIAKVSERAVEVSGLVVTEAHRYSDISKDVAERFKVQVARWDNTVDDTREQVQHAGGAVKYAVTRPFREAEGVISGIRTGIAAYLNGRRATVQRVTQDEEMFI